MADRVVTIPDGMRSPLVGHEMSIGVSMRFRAL